jgi:hypothetical protein
MASEQIHIYVRIDNSPAVQAAPPIETAFLTALLADEVGTLSIT